MFRYLFFFLFKSKRVNGNIFNLSMFIPISRHPTIHVKFGASLVTPQPLFAQNQPLTNSNGLQRRYLAKRRPIEANEAPIRALVSVSFSKHRFSPK